MDNVIHVTNTGIRIDNFKAKVTCPSLEKENSIFDPTYHRMIPITGFLKKKVYYTYRYNLAKLQARLPNYRVEQDLPEYTWEARPFKFNDDIDFTDLQNATVEDALKTRNPRVFINLQTGRGKTFVGIRLIELSHKKALITCYSSKVLAQWVESFHQHTNIDIKRVLIINSYTILDKIVNQKIDTADYDIYLLTPSLLVSYSKRYDWSKINRVVERMHIGVKIYDEAHRNIQTMIMLDSNSNVERTYYLSADFNQSNPEKARHYFSMFWDVPVINPALDVRNDALGEIDLNYVNVVCIDYNSTPNDIAKSACFTKRGFNNFNYMRYQFAHDMIFRAIDKCVTEMLPLMKGYKFLILTSLIEHIPVLVDHVKSLVGTQKVVGGYHGDMSAEGKQWTLDHAEIIIATYSSFSVGVDVKGIQFVLSLDQVDPITDNQAAGRARPIPGRKAYYFMVSDIGFERCINSRKKRISYLKSTKASGFYSIWIDPHDAK